MKEFIKYRYSSVTILAIVCLIFIFSKCVNKGTATSVIKNFKGQQFAGSITCANCHKNVYDSHVKTAHYLTSRIATKGLISGSFEQGKNKFTYNQQSTVAMERRNDGFYQVEYKNGIEIHAHRFDIVIGSGTMGQSYLTWDRAQLFQLPVSYFEAAHEWANSPGFPNEVIFNRVVNSRCLECHSTFAKTLSVPDIDPEKFDSTQMLYGVDCEKCHGPAAQHVEFQAQNPAINSAKYIINPAKLSRQQNMDLCASCHGGRLYKSRPSFQFMVGDTLSHFFTVDNTPPDPNNIDVHGNQYGLLRASKCFRMSETLTCNTCHNTHENEKGKAALFSQRCMSCHNNEHGNFCKVNGLTGVEIKNNCIDCHMPLKLSRKIAVDLPGSNAPIAASIRSHLISVHPEEAKRVMMFMKGRR